VDVNDKDTVLIFDSPKDLLNLFADPNIAPNSVKALNLRFAIGSSAPKDHSVLVIFEDSDKLWINYQGAFTTGAETLWDLNFATTTGDVKVRVYDSAGGYNQRHLVPESLMLSGDSSKTAQPSEMKINSDYTELIFTNRKALLELFTDPNIKAGSTPTLNLSFALKGGVVKSYPLVVTFTDNNKLWVNYTGSFTPSMVTPWDRNFSYASGEVKLEIYDANGGYNHAHLNQSSVVLRGNNKVVNVTGMSVKGQYTELVFAQKAKLFELLGNTNPLPGTVFPITLEFSFGNGALRSYNLMVKIEDIDRTWVNYNGTFYVDAPTVWDLIKYYTGYKDVKFRIYDASGGYNHVHVNPSSLVLRLPGKSFTKMEMSVKSTYTEVKIPALYVGDLIKFLVPAKGTSTITPVLSFSFADTSPRDYSFRATLKR
jgi:hypothetical protein